MDQLSILKSEFGQKTSNEASPSMIAIICRDSLMSAIQLIYQESGATLPRTATMLELLDGPVIAGYISDRDIIDGLHFVRILGMNAEHGKKVKQGEADLALQNMSSLYELIQAKESGDDTYTKPPYMSEYMTRKLYIDQYLEEAGWEVMTTKNVVQAGKAAIEIQVEGMPNPQGIGFCDYVLYGKDGKPLAIVEAKKTSVDPSKGRHQVDLYGECMKAKYGYKPVLYYTNGYTTKVIDGLYPDREVAATHSLSELEWLIQRRGRGDITDLTIDDEITNRPYQKIAITKLCERFNEKHRRGLLVMATGTGKTRVAISLVDVLTRNNWVKTVLFLADRTSLVHQAKVNFNKLLPNLSVCELSAGEKDYNARLMFSTYQTMINYIDAEDKLFTSGRFDLVIIDEAHRSIFNRYGSIFDYYDSLLVGLTATPKDEVDSNTYRLFGCESGVPNFDYSLDEAIKDHYLVPYKVINKTTALLDRGIKYSELSQDEKDQLEEYFAEDETTPTPEFVVGKEDWFKKLYNKDTCRKVLEDLMTDGIRVDNGETLGKTVIFAYNHKHAQLIVDCFYEMYPAYGENYCQLVDNYVKYADDLVVKFGEDDSFRIAVSVDMLDTGVDIPEITNLVFFKPVRSKIKFVQMIGRGTRLSEDLFGLGKHKDHFLIFDYCRNFEFFEIHKEGASPTTTYTLSQRLFDAKLDLLFELQRLEYQQDEYCKGYYDSLKTYLIGKVKEIKDHSERIQVRKQMQYVDKYCDIASWESLSAVDVKEIKLHLTPLLDSGLEGDAKVLAFDIRMFYIELSVLMHNNVSAATKHVMVVRKIAKYLLDEKASISQVLARSNELKTLVSEQYWSDVSVQSLEDLREAVRDLMTFIDGPARDWTVDIHDQTEDRPEIEDKYSGFDIRTYREKVIDYLAEHSDSEVIRKIKNIEPITNEDLDELQRVLWEELGTQEDYYNATDNDNVAAFVRSLVGLDQDTVNRRFGDYLSGNNYNSRQQEFIRAIINYVRENGDISKEDLLNTEPFDNYDLMLLFGEQVGAVLDVVNTLHDSIRMAA